MRISLFISTFDKPGYLVRTFAGIRRQTRPPDEILIADDGSAEPTRDLIRRFRALVPYPVIHVRQEHKGWRKCRMLNKCVAESTGEYLVFTDGDCIHRKDWLATHARFAKAGRFLAGGDLRINRAATERITVEDVESGRAFSAIWLLANGMKWRRSMVKILTPRAIAPVVDWVNFTPARFSGSNASCWRKDVEKVNGFDERFSWGKDDVEFGQRLRNAGVGTMHVRYNAICLHLDHVRDHVPPGSQERNFAMLAEINRDRLVHAGIGLGQVSQDFEVERETPSADVVVAPQRTPAHAH